MQSMGSGGFQIGFQSFPAQFGRFDIAAIFQEPNRRFQHFFCDTTGSFCFLFGIAIKKELGKDFSGGFVNGQACDFVGIGLFQDNNSA